MPRIYYELIRNPNTDNEEYLEAYIEYRSTCTVHACEPTRTDPGWPDEWEHQVTEIGFVTSSAQPNPPAMTDAERAECVAYFEAHQAEANEAASEAADDFYDRADYEYDKWRDRLADADRERDLAMYELGEIGS